MLMNRPAFFMLAPLALTMLAGCHKEVAPTPETSQSTPDTAQTAVAQSTSAQSSEPAGRLVLAVIAGRPAAAYIAWRNTGTAPVTITGIEVASAKSADMHETKDGAMLPLPKLVLAPGEEANFAPGGRHVMVFGLPADVKAGDHLAYRLLLSDGSKLTGTLSVEAAGASHDMGAHDMSGHDMGNMKM